MSSSPVPPAASAAPQRSSSRGAAMRCSQTAWRRDAVRARGLGTTRDLTGAIVGRVGEPDDDTEHDFLGGTMNQLTLTEVGGDLAATVALSGDGDTAVGDDDVLVAVEAAPINNGGPAVRSRLVLRLSRRPERARRRRRRPVVTAGANVDPSPVGRRVVMLPTFEHGTWADETGSYGHTALVSAHGRSVRTSEASRRRHRAFLEPMASSSP